MKPVSKQVWILIVWIVAALTIIGSALWFKGTHYENAWLYLLGVWFVLVAFIEIVLRRK